MYCVCMCGCRYNKIKKLPVRRWGPLTWGTGWVSRLFIDIFPTTETKTPAIFKITMPLCHFLHSDIIFHFKVPCEFQTRAWYPIVSRPLSAIDMTMIVLAKYPLLRGGHSHRQPTFIVFPPLQLSFTCNRWCPLTLDSRHCHKKQRKREISGLRQIQASGGSIRYQYY